MPLWFYIVLGVIAVSALAALIAAIVIHVTGDPF